MPATRITWRDAQSMPEDGKGVAEYWVVDPDAKQVEVWRFAAGASEAARYTERMPVTLGGRGRRRDRIAHGGRLAPVTYRASRTP